MTQTSVRFQVKRLLHSSGLVTATYLFTVNATKLQEELSCGALETITNVRQVFQLLVPENKNCFETRKSSCVNAGGIPPAAYQVLHLLSYPEKGYPTSGWGVPHLWTGDSPLLDGGYPIPGQGPPIWTWLRYPLPPSGPGQGSHPPIWAWLGYPPHLDLAGVPCPRAWTDKQIETITFPHPSDASGNKGLSGVDMLLVFDKG